jgi:hypothetical protein
MKLEELIYPYMVTSPFGFPATLRTFFPQTIETPFELHSYFGKTWLNSEWNKHEEIGGNLTWVAGSRDEDWSVVKPDDISTGVGGNAVAIPSRAARSNVADFHTHPSTPGGKNLSRCGYQPPSLEDLMGMQSQEGHGKDIFVSFVVAHTSELYAMVYIRGVSHFDTNKLYEIKGDLDEKGKRIKFPSDAAEEKYLAIVGKDPYNPTHLRSADKEVCLATDFGERFAPVVEEHLKSACNVCGIGLYRGPIGASLQRV